MLRFTPRALSELVAILASRGMGPGAGLRISRHPRPEEGYRYLFQAGPERFDGDQVLEQEGVRIVLDPAAQRDLEGYEVDFMDDLLNRGFVFRAPGAQQASGCGTCQEPPVPV